MMIQIAAQLLVLASWLRDQISIIELCCAKSMNTSSRAWNSTLVLCMYLLAGNIRDYMQMRNFDLLIASRAAGTP